MARILYSALVTSINGSIAGTTFQRNAYGHTVKKKPNIVNPNTLRQSPARANLQYLSQVWQSLTTVQRNAWDAYATANPVASRLNPNAYLSGHAQWLRVNLLRLQTNLGLLNTIVSSAQTVLLPNGIDVSWTNPNLFLEDDATDSLNILTGVYSVSAVVKASQLYDKSRTRFVFYGNLNGALVGNITAKYQQTFGNIAVTGQQVFVRAAYLNRNNGQVIYTPSINQQVL